jgi:hypothetical protein
MLKPAAEQPPYLITSAEDAAAVLSSERVRRGWTGEELDYRAGVAERHSCKLENPGKAWGRAGLMVSHAWCCVAEALGLCLVIMPRHVAANLGALPAPARPMMGNRSAEHPRGEAHS